MKLVSLLKMRRNETYSEVRMGTNLAYMFPAQNGLKQDDLSSPLLFNFALEYAITKVSENKNRVKVNKILVHQFLVYADYASLLRKT
jgi:hypothetical protein